MTSSGLSFGYDRFKDRMITRHHPLGSKQDREDEAGPLLERALAIGKAAFGPEHPDVALILNTQANLFYFRVRS